jgi:hypothetical protein
MTKSEAETLFRHYRRSFVEAEGEPSFLMMPSMTLLPTRTSVDKVRWVRGICYDPAFPPTWPELQAKTIEIFGQDCLPRAPKPSKQSKQWDRVCLRAGCSDLKLAPHKRPLGRPPTPPGQLAKRGWRKPSKKGRRKPSKKGWRNK